MGHIPGALEWGVWGETEVRLGLQTAARVSGHKHPTGLDWAKQFSAVVDGKKKSLAVGARSHHGNAVPGDPWAWLRGTGRSQQLRLFSQIQLSLIFQQGASFHNPESSIMMQSSWPLESLGSPVFQWLKLSGTPSTHW